MSSTMKTNTLNIGIAGLGRLGKRHAKNLAHHTRGASLIAACSPENAELDWARSNLGINRCHHTLEQMLADTDVDAVVLVTPTTLHAEQTIACIRAGKHVFVEKPLSLDVATCQSVEAVAKEYPHLIAMVGFMRRFDPSYAEAKAAIDRGELGQIFLVRSQTCDQNDPSGAFIRFARSSGGIFMDCSVHDIDLARWMLGNPKATRVFASGTVAVHKELQSFGDVDNGLAIVEFEGGQRAVFYASRTMPHGHESTTEVIGTFGTLQVGMGAHSNRIQHRNSQGVFHTALPDFFARFDEAFELEMQAFVSACLGEISPPLTLNDATEATRIGHAITQSLHNGSAINIS